MKLSHPFSNGIRFSILDFLILTQCVYLFIGITLLHFEMSLLTVFFTVVVCLLTDSLLSFVYHKKLIFSKSAIATALGICLFLRADYLLFFLIASLISIGSKYIIRYKNRHFFNPSNFGVVLTALLFTSNATIELSQWGNNSIFYLFVLITALAIAKKARAIVTTLSFLFSYFVLLLLTLPFFPTLVSVHHYGMIGPSLIIFAAFMLTDPKTSPTQWRLRVLHGITIAFVYFFLEIIEIRYALLLASFLIACLNFLFTIVTDLLPVKRTRVFSPQTYSFFTGCVAFVLLFLFSLQSSTFEFSPFSISYKFLLFGIESQEFLTCPAKTAFADVTTQSHLTIPPVVKGIAWGDFNNDGFDDVFISNIMLQEHSHLYTNNRDGTFTDITQQAGLPYMHTEGAYFVDYDNDGLVDLFITVISPKDNYSNYLAVYKNLGNGKFKDVTKAVHLDTVTTEQTNMTESFADYNNDGYLDFVTADHGYIDHVPSADYVAFTKSLFDPLYNAPKKLVCEQNDVRTMLLHNPETKRYIDTHIPDFYRRRGCLLIYNTLPIQAHTNFLDTNARTGLVDVDVIIPGQLRLFQNNHGVFQEVKKFRTYTDGLYNNENSSINPIQDQTHPFSFNSKSYYQPISFDYNNDSLPDIFVTDDYASNLMLKNLGNFQFADVTSQTGVDYSGTGMGVDIADVDKNGYQDMIITNVRNDYLFMNNNGKFTLNPQKFSPLGIGWGVSFLDYNLDGNQDMFIVNGDVIRTYHDTAFTSLGKAFFRANKLYAGDGNGHFTDKTWQDYCPDLQSGKALAVSDYNNDGKPDLLIGNYILQDTDQSRVRGTILYKNVLDTKNHYLSIKLHGTISNRQGIGSRVQVKTEHTNQTKLVLLGNSFYSQNTTTQLFGLGNDTSAEVIVHWPSGRVTRKHIGHVDTSISIQESEK